MKKAISLFVCFALLLAIIPASSFSAESVKKRPSYLFAIDAGHGGSDPGSTRCDGKYESDDTAKIANEVIKLLKEQGQRTVLINRNLKTQDRPAEANNANADFLISLHRDATKTSPSSARGISVYTHEPTHKQRKEQPEKDYAPAEHSNKHQMDEKLVNNLKTYLTGATAIPFRGVYYGSASAPTWEDYYINRLSNMPSCIIELGFGTNAEDNKIFDAQYKTLAAAIVKALLVTVDLDYLISGKTGSCDWVADSGILTVSGDGAMQDYTDSSAAPWGNAMTDVEILKGVTAIGDYSFYQSASLVKTFIPVTVSEIGENAFDGCSGLTDVYYGGSEEQWDAIDIKGGNDVLTKVAVHYDFENYNDLLQVGGIWRYYKNGVVDRSNTLVKFYGTWYHVNDGYINFKEGETLVNFYGTWYYVTNGVVPLKGETLVKYYGTWYHVKNGVFNPKEGETLVKYGSTWYYCNKGVAPLKGETLVNYYGTWYHVKNGVFNPKEGATLVKYGDTWYYCNKGCLNFGYTGKVVYGGKTYRVVKGIRK